MVFLLSSPHSMDFGHFSPTPLQSSVPSLQIPSNDYFTRLHPVSWFSGIPVCGRASSFPYRPFSQPVPRVIESQVAPDTPPTPPPFFSQGCRVAVSDFALYFFAMVRLVSSIGFSRELCYACLFPSHFDLPSGLFSAPFFCCYLFFLDRPGLFSH